MQDQTIRVFRLEDHFNVYTLHGHCGPITAAFVDHGSSGGGDTGSERDHCAGTGSQVRLKRSLVLLCSTAKASQGGGLLQNLF